MSENKGSKKNQRVAISILLTLMLGVGILLLILFLSVPFGMKIEFLKAIQRVGTTPIVSMWVVLFFFFFFYFLYLFYKNLSKREIAFGKWGDFWDRLSISVLYALLGVMLFLILSKSLIIFNSGFGRIKDPNDTFIQLLGVLLMMVTVILTAGSIFLFRKLKKIDELEEYLKELRETTSISANLIMTTLPPLGVTIQVPNQSMRILTEIDSLIRRSHYLRDYVEDEKNIETGPRIQFARAIYGYGCDDEKCIDIFKEQVIKKKIDRETRLSAKLRLGIAYRQFGKLEEAYGTFEELREATTNYLYYNTFARIGLGFTRYMQYKDRVHWKSGGWGSPEARVDGQTRALLKEAYDSFKKLWDEGNLTSFSKNAYVSDYLAKTAYDMKAIGAWYHAGFRNEKELKEFIKKVSKFTIHEISIIVPKGNNDWEVYIRPFLEDFAFLADYYLSLAINCHFLAMLEEEKSKMLKIRDITLEKSRRYASMVRDTYDPWPLITSEKHLKMVKAEVFLKEIEGLFVREA